MLHIQLWAFLSLLALNPLSAQAQANNETVYIGLKTGNQVEAGSNADIYVVYELKGRRASHRLDKWEYNDFERGDFEWYKLFDNIPITDTPLLRVWLEVREGDDWYVQEMCIAEQDTTGAGYRAVSAGQTKSQQSSYSCRFVGTWLEEGEHTRKFSFSLGSRRNK